jgi:cell division septation protein DedD
MKQCVIFLALLYAVGDITVAQSTEPDIKKYVAAVNSGNADEVRKELPALVTKYPNNPGVLYVQGLVTHEGSEALRTYQSIVDNFPESEWADDALYRVYEFYYALGLYRTAEIKMQQLAERFPNSPYVKAAGTRTAQSTVVTDEPDAVPPVSAPTAAETPKTETPKIEAPAKEKELPVVPLPDASAGTQPSPESTPVQSDTAIPVRFVLQTGAFGQQSNAEILKTRFESAGYPVEMISKVKDTRALFLVWVGSYSTYEEARAAAQEVKRTMGIDAMVISR